MAHTQGSKAVVIGASFGAKTINAYLNLAKDYQLELANRYIGIEGGRFQETFSGTYYKNQMINPNIINHPAFSEGYVFPQQSDGLPVKVRRLVTAFVNQTDDVALEQERCWGKADKTILIPGSHFTGVAKHIFTIRKIINEDIGMVKTQPT